MIYYSQYLGTQGGEYLSHGSEGFLKWISNQTVDTAKIGTISEILGDKNQKLVRKFNMFAVFVLVD